MWSCVFWEMSISLKIRKLYKCHGVCLPQFEYISIYVYMYVY